MWIAWFVPALAAEVSVAPDGAMTSTVVVSASAEAALALLRDPLAVHTLSADPGTLRATPDGACTRIAYERSTFVGPVAYTARGCPTESGYRTDLTESASFSRMTTEWRVRPVPGGAEVTYRYDADVTAPVPDFIVRRSTVAAVGDLMDRLVARLR